MDDAFAHWLQLREPADTAARSSALTAALLPVLTARGDTGPLRVLDLGSGTGANVRYLAPRLPGKQEWLAVDRNPALLARLHAHMTDTSAGRGGEGPRYDVATRVVNLDVLNDESLFAGRQLVTASALLDLASERWLTALAAGCRAERAAVLFALSYDGSSTCWPAEPEDEMVRDLLNRHQHRDQGLGGPAAGPAAAGYAVRCFVEAGYHVRTTASPWTLGQTEHELQRQLVNGWRDAAVELVPDAAETIVRWHARRHAHIDGIRSRIVVHHIDIAAWPQP